MASVRKLNPKDPASPWVVEYTEPSTGKRRRVTPKSGLKKDAEAARRRVEAEIENGEHVAASQTMKIVDVCELYIRHAEDKVHDGRIGKGRLRQIRMCFDNSFIPHIGHIVLTNLTPTDVEGLYQTLVRAGLRPVTARHRLWSLKLVEEFAIKRGLAKKRPVAAAIRELRGIEDRPIRTFKRDDVKTLLQTVATKSGKQHYRAQAMLNCVVNLAAFCGLRYGEIMGLTVESFDPERRMLRVRHSLSQFDGLKAPKTRAGVRDVPVPPHIVTMLQNWLERHFVENEHGLVFRTPSGGDIFGPSFHTHYWRPLLLRAGFNEGEALHFHALRHFYASNLIDHGVPVTEVASLMGHAKFDMTLQVYAHPIVGGHRLHDVVDRMATGCLDNPTGKLQKKPMHELRPELA